MINLTRLRLIAIFSKSAKGPFISSDCDVAPKSNQLFWCCIVTPSDCDVAVMSLGNRFVSHSGAMPQRHRRCVAVTRCKWALNCFGKLYFSHRQTKEEIIIHLSFLTKGLACL